MSKPVIAQKGPYQRHLAPGTYMWCQCGQSNNQPFCDGSHKGGEFLPLKVEVTDAGMFALCGCKHSGNKPYCDGTHNTLDD